MQLTGTILDTLVLTKVLHFADCQTYWLVGVPIELGVASRFANQRVVTKGRLQLPRRQVAGR